MTLDSDPVLREVFLLWPAYGVLAEYLAAPCTEDARTIDPHDLYGRACTAEHPRLVALLYAHGHGDSMFEADAILTEILAMAEDGRRPKYGAELGLVFGPGAAA